MDTNPYAGFVQGASVPQASAPEPPNPYEQFKGGQPTFRDMPDDGKPQPAPGFIGRMAGAASDLLNNIYASLQGTSPVVRQSSGKLNYEPLGKPIQTDFGPAFETPEGDWERIDPNKHVVLRDPKTGNMTVFERNGAADQSAASSVGHLFTLGAINPTPFSMPDAVAASRAAAAIPPARQLLSDYRQLGIPPNLPAIAQSPSLNRVANTIKEIPLAGSPIEAGANRTAAAASQAAENVAGAYGQSKGPLEGGEAAQQGAETFKGSPDGAALSLGDARSLPTRTVGFRQKAEALYNAIPISGAAKMYVPETVSALRGLSSKFPSNPQLGQELIPPKFQNLLDAITTGGRDASTGQFRDPRLTWDEVQQFRSWVGRQISRPQNELGLGADDWRNLYGATSRDMEAMAQNSGPEALKAFTQANAYYSAGLDRIKNALSLVQDARSPEQAFSKLIKTGQSAGSLQDVGKFIRIVRSMPDEQRGDVAAAVIRGLGEPTAGAKNPLAEFNFSPDRFVTNYANIQPSAKDALFGATGTARRNSLDALSRVMAAEKNVAKLRNPSGTGRVTLTGLTGYGLAEHPVSTMAALVTAHLGARALMNPTITNWIVLAGRAANPLAWSASIGRLDALAKANPEFAGGLRDLAATLRANSPDNGSSGSPATGR